MEPCLFPACRGWYRRVATRASPLKLFEALYAERPYAFLYESLEARGTRGRYSFLGARPRAVFEARRDQYTLRSGQRLDVVQAGRGAPLDALRRLIPRQSDTPPVAPFCGGAVGYLSYDAVRWCENLPARHADDAGVPDACFLFPQEVICFDHLEKVVHVLLFMDGGQPARFEQIVAALARIADADREGEPPGEPRLGPDLALPADPDPAGSTALEASAMRSNMTQAEFEAMVLRAKEYILAGDVFQVVLSQRLEFPLTAPPQRLYKALRDTNPSPYMYYLRLGELHIAGSSPEILVKLIGRKVVTRPLAGTRRRGRTAEEDEALAAELRADPKERAEHVMLVDLGRNDLGRVCEYGSVRLTETLEIERHSKVMHLVSNVEGWLRDGLDAFDVFRAVFPAGTVSGAPKVRAMQIIDELEPDRRGVYAGAIGYFSLLGDLDLCIAIRTIVMHGGRGYIQAGAGIVADSVPAREYDETLNKARALWRAVQLAG